MGNLAPINESEKRNIVNSIVKCVKEGMEHLTNSAYQFIYLASGFIAHYNKEGFIDHYSSGGNFKKDILDNKAMNQWDNFREGENNYEYYMSRKEVYNEICEAIEKIPTKIKITAQVSFDVNDTWTEEQIFAHMQEIVNQAAEKKNIGTHTDVFHYFKQGGR